MHATYLGLGLGTLLRSSSAIPSSNPTSCLGVEVAVVLQKPESHPLSPMIPKVTHTCGDVLEHVQAACRGAALATSGLVGGRVCHSDSQRASSLEASREGQLTCVVPRHSPRVGGVLSFCRFVVARR